MPASHARTELRDALRDCGNDLDARSLQIASFTDQLLSGMLRQGTEPTPEVLAQVQYLREQTARTRTEVNERKLRAAMTASSGSAASRSSSAAA